MARCLRRSWESRTSQQRHSHTRFTVLAGVSRSCSSALCTAVLQRWCALCCLVHGSKISWDGQACGGCTYWWQRVSRALACALKDQPCMWAGRQAGTASEQVQHLRRAACSGGSPSASTAPPGRSSGMGLGIGRGLSTPFRTCTAGAAWSMEGTHHCHAREQRLHCCSHLNRSTYIQKHTQQMRSHPVHA